MCQNGRIGLPVSTVIEACALPYAGCPRQGSHPLLDLRDCFVDRMTDMDGRLTSALEEEKKVRHLKIQGMSH